MWGWQRKRPGIPGEAVPFRVDKTSSSSPTIAMQHTLRVGYIPGIPMTGGTVGMADMATVR